MNFIWIFSKILQKIFYYFTDQSILDENILQQYVPLVNHFIDIIEMRQALIEDEDEDEGNDLVTLIANCCVAEILRLNTNGPNDVIRQKMTTHQMLVGILRLFKIVKLYNKCHSCIEGILRYFR